MTLLVLEGVRRSFGGIVAADGIDLTLAAGERRCLIGPNGAGKSTVFKLIMGLLRPDAGSIRFDGREITREEPFRRVQRGLSMKYQTTRIFPSLTVSQNISIARSRGDEATDIVAWGLDRLGLASLGSRPAGELSYGQQHWLEMCMVLGNRPRVVLMDEPTAGMTPEESRRTGTFVRELADRDIAAIVIEHDMGFVRDLEAPTIVLHQGKVFREGGMADIETDPEVQRIYLGEVDA
jgi:branched-chain amino acid transport system ATP-binding protein